MSVAMQRDVSLQGFNTLRAPSVARFYARVGDLSALRAALNFASEQRLPVLLLGGGSNVLLAEYIDALVLQVDFSGVEIQALDNGKTLVSAGAGVNWHELVLHCHAAGAHGLENLALIPGTVGAAPIQNIGAYGVEMADFFQDLEAVDLHSGQLRLFNKNECAFAYRDSIFKQAARGRYVIVKVRFMLANGAALPTQYPALKAWLAAQHIARATPADVLRAVIAIRQSKLPDPKQLPNAGSFFKNPLVSAAHFESLRLRFPQIVAFDASSGEKKLSAAWLIDQLGWKGRAVEGIVVHAQHALVLTNPQALPARQILAAARCIAATVEERFAVRLEMEPQCLGDFPGAAGNFLT